MSWLKAMFNTEKPIIGMLHLGALPGDPFYDHGCGLRLVTDNAKRDLEALQEGGIDAILITNEFSIPYEKHVSPVTLAAMCTVIGALRWELSVPMGAEAIYDGDATIDLCAATAAQFTRCLFTGAWSGDLGIVDRDIAYTLRHKSALRLDDLRLFYFVTSEDERNLAGRPTAEITATTISNCRPDALVAGGAGPGQKPSRAYLGEIAAAAKDTPLFCGTGCSVANIADVMDTCSGAFVGSSLKIDGDFRQRIDRDRVSQLMTAVRDLR